jgi:hypothetical protein
VKLGEKMVVEVEEKTVLEMIVAIIPQLIGAVEVRQTLLLQSKCETSNYLSIPKKYLHDQVDSTHYHQTKRTEIKDINRYK